MSADTADNHAEMKHAAVAAPVTLAIESGVAEIRLCRPDRLNSFDAETAQIWSGFAQQVVAHEGVRAIVLSGEGRAFCAGGDVRAMAAMSARGAQITQLAQVINAGLIALLESAIPVVVAAHGTTAGGGLGLLLSSDYAVVGASSKVGSRYAAIGLTPDLGVSALLARAVGERRALQLTLNERMLSAEEALQWGLVAEVVPDQEVLARAREIAAHWASQAPDAYGATKRLMRGQVPGAFRDQLQREAETIGRFSETAVARERILRFAGS